MIPYYLMIGIPVLMSLITAKEDETKRKQRYPIIAFFIIFILLLSLRSVQCGTDLVNYRYKFEKANFSSLKAFFDTYFYEPGFYLALILCKHVCNNFQFFLIFCAVVSVIPIMILYVKTTNHCILTIALFVGIAPFTIFFSGLRQAIAIGLSAVCYFFCKKNKIIPFFLVVFLAFWIHRSSAVLLLMYPLTHIKITKKWIGPLAVIFSLCMLFQKNIFKAVLALSDKYESRYEISDTGSYTFLVMLILLTLFAFVLLDDADSETVKMRNLLVLTLFIQAFAPINTVVMRLNYYYLIFVPILIPEILDNCKSQYRQIARLCTFVFSLFFIFWFFKEAYIGSDILHVFPYVPFWEG